MGLELRQQLKLTQQLVMTPQLQQAIRLLQLSRVELMETIQEELLENPFLEVSEFELSDQNQDERPLDINEAYEEAISLNADWEDYLGDFSSSSKQASVYEADFSDDGMAYDARYSSDPSLDSHLLWQLRLSDLSDEEKEIGEIIISNLSSTGYLEATIEDICSLSKAGEEKVEKILHYIQRLDPVGVAARAPQECLRIQMEVLGLDKDPILLALATEHLEDIEARRYQPLMRKLKLTTEELGEYLEILQTLDPLPGASFGTGQPQYVSPDAYVYPLDDDFIIALNDEGLPELQLSSFYEDSLQKSEGEDKDFLQEKMRSASWLIRSLHQRQRTLYKVVESIVRFQNDFFHIGVKALKPLILKDVADDIEMHESTVSRITTNKYVATPHGIFELKYFFNSALSSSDGTEVGSESVKAYIKRRIDEEDPKKPLSDERIGEMIKEELNVSIARRTVAKYRNSMDIPASSRRRDIF